MAATADPKPDVGAGDHVKSSPAGGGSSSGNGGSAADSAAAGSANSAVGSSTALIVEASDVEVMVRQNEEVFKRMSGAAERLASDMKALANRTTARSSAGELESRFGSARTAAALAVLLWRCQDRFRMFHQSRHGD